MRKSHKAPREPSAQTGDSRGAFSALPLKSGGQGLFVNLKPEEVAHTANGFDMAGGLGAQLGADATNMHVNGA